jgi:hypothetical protein
VQAFVAKGKDQAFTAHFRLFFDLLPGISACGVNPGGIKKSGEFFMKPCKDA